MLSLCFHGGAAVGRWQRFGNKLQGPHGWVEVLDHTMVSARAVIDGPNLGLLVLEHPCTGEGGSASLDVEYGDSSCRERLRGEASNWPLHWFWLEADTGSLVVECSPLPTVPIYVTGNGEYARGDWDPHRLLPFIRPRLNTDVAAYFLCTFEQPYSNLTLLEDMQHVAGGYRAVWRAGQNGGWQLTAPASAPGSYPRALRPEADPVATFQEIVSAATERIAGSCARVASGLSGGLDSSLVCGTLARNGHEVHSFGILVPDEGREGQRKRRAAAVRRFGLDDSVECVGSDYSPWSGPGRRLLPWDELYHAPFESLYQRAKRRGHQMFFTGLGGDDLLSPYWEELPEDGRRERAEFEGEIELPDLFTAQVRRAHKERAAALNDLPRAFVQRSVMDSAAGMAAQTLRHGLWPVHPLISPEVVRYCHALPMQWRQSRKLIRDALMERGLPKCLYQPDHTESFEGMCVTAMRHCPEFARLIQAPRLADMGLVEPTRVAKAFQAWLASPETSSAMLPLVAIATLEAALDGLASPSSFGMSN